MSPLAGTDISTAIPLDTPSPKSVADAEQISSAMKGELLACICLTLAADCCCSSLTECSKCFDGVLLF